MAFNFPRLLSIITREISKGSFTS